MGARDKRESLPLHFLGSANLITNYMNKISRLLFANQLYKLRHPKQQC